MVSRTRLWFLLRTGLICAAIIILFFSGIFPVEEWLSALPTGNLTASVAASDVASLTNEQRIENGLAPLNVSPLLSQAAELKAADMARNSYYAHTGPDGKTPLSWLDDVGYHYLNAGENLVIDRTSASQAVAAWMGSPEHRENILRPQFTEIGVGVAEGEYEGVGTIFVVEEFGTPYPAYTAPRKAQTNTVVHTQAAVVPIAASPRLVASDNTGTKAETSILTLPVVPKISTLAAPANERAKVAAMGDHQPGKGTAGYTATSTDSQQNKAAPITSTSSVSFALAPEFFKPVSVPQTRTAPASPEAASASRLSVWLDGIKTYFSKIIGF